MLNVVSISCHGDSKFPVKVPQTHYVGGTVHLSVCGPVTSDDTEPLKSKDIQQDPSVLSTGACFGSAPFSTKSCYMFIME